ncbi:hypothetical protein ACEPPN_017899 [Leptodophora sp. 'Broadleaf-Isolate-01']
MTTVYEMDELFNFEGAAHPLGNNGKDIDFSHLISTGAHYDIDLALVEAQDDENSFMCIQHFTATDEDLKVCLPNNGVDVSTRGPDDFMDFPCWIDGMDVPAQPCSNCRRVQTHCKIIREGHLKGSCTSGVALQQVCSFMGGDRNSNMRKRDSFTGALEEEVYDMDDNCVPSNEPTDRRSYYSTGAWSKNGDGSMEEDAVQGPFPHNISAPNLLSMHGSQENFQADNGDSTPKVGARFSRESVRTLRGWLSTHHRHPYPTDEEKEALTRQTGLNKTQITNWLANARRRGKVRALRSTSPGPNQSVNAMDIPRRATPSIEQMTPLDRWKTSPPENEAACMTAISKAVTSSTFSSGRDSPYSYGNDGSNRSLHDVSSTSSFGTSHSSGGSFASAFSHKSNASFNSFGSIGNRGRRRRRRQAVKTVQPLTSAQPVRTFQCTFCTETFKTKHDWQRHEKSLHLSLERWICCPDGPTQFCKDTYTNRCVFCGLANPRANHAEVHNYLSCAERLLEERTFYRKDHLRQHLNLVHDVKFQAFSMETWKVATPEIRSRCGFCGIVMYSWTMRVDHLAEHFKGGKSMADWVGDWGFDADVLDIVENGMPPYLIHDERNSMDPYSATKDAINMDRSLEDWVKIGLVEYVHQITDSRVIPTDDDLLLEGRKIIRRAEERSSLGLPEVCWVRDLLMLSGNHPEIAGPQNHELTWAKKLEKISDQVARTNDLHQITCTKQRALKAFVNSKGAIGLTPTNRELQDEACRILDESEAHSAYQCPTAINWLKYLIRASTGWLEEFRRKVGLPRSAEIADEIIRSTDDLSIDYSIHNGARLEKELIDFVTGQRLLGIVPTDEDLQREARLIIYGNDDAWNQTLADDPNQLLHFKRLNGLAPPLDVSSSLVTRPVFQPESPRTLHWDLDSNSVYQSPQSGNGSGSRGNTTPNLEVPATLNQPSARSKPVQHLKYFLNDAQCYGRLMRQLTRFVKTSMSPNNPNQHVPSDAEIQHHARVIIYDDDDPWNQTAADNAEWLIRFKRDVGLAAPENGPGLAEIGTNTSWRYEKGGTGLKPPYVCPKELPTAYTEDLRVKMDAREFDVKAKTAARWLATLKERFQNPAQVFCSRELEEGLNVYVKTSLKQGFVPTDAQIQARAREILGVDRTSAEDLDLLQRFKALHGITSSDTQLQDTYPIIDDAMLAEFDAELERVNFKVTGHFPGTEISTSSSPLTMPMTALSGMNSPMTNVLANSSSNPGVGMNMDINPGISKCRK